jgi:aldehyde:ferredoxin oxidoreductase
MGSKRLKAVAVRAAKGSRIQVADKEGLKAVQRGIWSSSGAAGS